MSGFSRKALRVIILRHQVCPSGQGEWRCIKIAHDAWRAPSYQHVMRLYTLEDVSFYLHIKACSVARRLRHVQFSMVCAL